MPTRCCYGLVGAAVNFKTMEREIKFRAWDNEHKEWIHTFRFGLNLEGSLTDNNLDKIPHLYWTGKGSRFTLNQYTGLKDKNGEEIYEGDIIHHGQEETEGEKNEVIFQNGEFGMKWQSQSLWHILCDSHFCEVIGNIYENAGLLAVAPTCP